MRVAGAFGERGVVFQPGEGYMLVPKRMLARVCQHAYCGAQCRTGTSTLHGIIFSLSCRGIHLHCVCVELGGAGCVRTTGMCVLAYKHKQIQILARQRDRLQRILTSLRIPRGYLVICVCVCAFAPALLSVTDVSPFFPEYV